MTDLSSLNPEQKEAVLDFDHNLLLLACAGSGKTRTITAKIAYAIEMGLYRPGEIVAVTFTNRAAKEMRDRVAMMLPESDISSLQIRTFHSLGAWLLRRFSDEAGLNSDFCIYDDDDSLSLLSSVVSLEKKELREIQKKISKAKDLGLSPDSGNLREISDSPDFRVYFRSYQEALDRTGNVDFADLIGRSRALLEAEGSYAAEYVHSRFRLILVDEYQDSNAEQFRFLKAFKGSGAKLVAVGDDDQSIYSFRGAEIRNILSFSKSFDDVREIKLERNYRSTDEILRPASALIKHNMERHDKEIISADGKKGQRPAVMVSATGMGEASRIAAIIGNVGDYSNTAILYRTNAQSLPFEQALTDRKIPYKVIGALKFYDREEIKDGLAFLYLLMNRRDSVSFRRIINKPARGLGEQKVNKILSLSDDIYEALKVYTENEKGSARNSALSFLNALKDAEKAVEEGQDLGDMIRNALYSTGLYGLYESEPDRAIRTTKLDNLGQLVSILSDVGTGRTALADFLEKLTLDTTVLGDHDPRDEEGVTLITMHNTKGLEFDRVFVVGLEQHLIPGKTIESQKEKEEERRILYVAMTRARRSLYLSFARTRKQWGRTEYTLPSCFLREIPKEMLQGEAEEIYKSGTASSSRPSGSSFSGYSHGTDPYSYVGHSTSYKPRTAAENKPAWASMIGDITEAKPKVNVVKKSSVRFSSGDRIKNPAYGEGTVVEVEERADGKRILTIQFSKNRAKFVEGKAPLEKL